MRHVIPPRFHFAGVACGIKQDATKRDLSLIVSERPCAAAGVYTQSQVIAAPVILDSARTPSSQIRAIVMNSGNANSCTGERGMQDALRMTELTAEALGISPEEVLVLSTGIIGEHLPMDCIERGIRDAASKLGRDEDHFVAAAEGMMTTDTYPKTSSRRVSIGNKHYGLAGVCKGAAMIGPNMATMLAVVVTDAPLTSATAHHTLERAVDMSFNCISVEGHMSTNDTVLLLSCSDGQEAPLEGDGLAEFTRTLNDLSIDLATMIPDDGEGATHLIEIQVDKCGTVEDARKIAQTVANSALVKTAVTGADPNWGRIVSAAGYSGVEFRPAEIELRVNGIPLFRHGQPLPFDAEAAANSIRSERITRIELSMGQGIESTRFWTCDLTAEYIRLNADYHT